MLGCVVRTLWGFTTPETTVYRVERSRSSQVVRETLGENFAGTLVSDCLASYDPPPYRKHKCIVHHLRAIHQARDRPNTKDPTYLRDCQLFFFSVLAIAGCRSSMGEAEFAERYHHLKLWRDKLLDAACEQTGDVAVRNRLRKQREHLLGCLDDARVEPTNNRAERALRPAVIARKISCGNKTEAGRRTWQILASLAATCHQRSQDFTDFLSQQLPLATPAG